MAKEAKDIIAGLDDNTVEAVLELYRRRRAMTSLFGFTCHTLNGFQPAPHHKLICDALDRVVSGKTRRLMITMPPRHGKSELASRRLPAYFLGRHPRKQVICATYNSDFAMDFGREVRNIMSEESFTDLFPTSVLSADSKSANRFNTAVGGTYYTTGIGAGLTGRGAHLGIIDDPIKSREEADSKHYRDRIYNWYRSVFYTRLMPKSSLILILTRWHDDDLAGRLLMEQRNGGEEWEQLSLKAVAGGNDPMGRSEGESLWPAWYPTTELQNIRNVIGPREWSALYQQEPIEDEGAYFKREWIEDNLFNRVQLMKEHKAGLKPMYFYGASDYAVTAEGGDYTVHLVIGVDSDDTIYILDMWRSQTETIDWVEAFCGLVEKWKPARWGEEAGQILKSVGPFIDRRMKERKLYCYRVQLSSAADKPTRARSVQARMSMGKIRFPDDSQMLDPMMFELCRFPAGTHDDIVDAFSLIGRMLDDFSSAPAYKPPEKDDLYGTTMVEMFKMHQNRRKGRGHLQAPVVGLPPKGVPDTEPALQEG